MSHRLEQERDKFPLILMISEGVYGVVIEQGAFVSRVRFEAGGFSHDVYVENDEFLALPNKVSGEIDGMQFVF